MTDLMPRWPRNTQRISVLDPARDPQVRRVTSLSDVSLSLRRGEIARSSARTVPVRLRCYNCLTGVYTPQEARYSSPCERARDQRARAQAVQGEPARGGENLPDLPMFSALTTFENVKIGVESKQHTGAVGAMLRLPRTRREEHESRSQDAGAPEVRRIDETGERDLELAALRGSPAPRDRAGPRDEPDVLLLDEPAAGPTRPRKSSSGS